MVWARPEAASSSYARREPARRATPSAAVEKKSGHRPAAQTIGPSPLRGRSQATPSASRAGYVSVPSVVPKRRNSSADAVRGTYSSQYATGGKACAAAVTTAIAKASPPRRARSSSGRASRSPSSRSPPLETALNELLARSCAPQ
eukprot:645496-Prymnesium_polylepis.1